GAGLVRTKLDLDALRRALRRIVARHDALRSTFPAVDEGPALRILDPNDVAAREDQWPLIEDVSALEIARSPARFSELVRRPFDLEGGPLFRLHLLTRSQSGPVVLPVFHHIISDFLSVAVFLDDLARAYVEEVTGMAAEWPTPPSFSNFVRQQDQS